MLVSRRGLLGILAAGVSAGIVRTPGLLMPIKPLRDVGVIRFGVSPEAGDTVTINGRLYEFGEKISFQGAPIEW